MSWVSSAGFPAERRERRRNCREKPTCRPNRGLLDLRGPARFRHSGTSPRRVRHLPRQAVSPGMTADTDHDPSREPMIAHEPARRGGSIALVLLVAGGVVAAALVLMTIG